MFVKELVNINSCNEVNIKVIVAMKYSITLQDTTAAKRQPWNVQLYAFKSWNNINYASTFLALKFGSAVLLLWSWKSDDLHSVLLFLKTDASYELKLVFVIHLAQ